MPLPAIPFLFVTISLASVGAAGAVTAVAISLRNKAKTELKSKPAGVPRPPRNMTRDELKRTAQEKLGMDITRYFNFGFCGGCSAGKSTLINALRNRDDVDLVEGIPHNIFGSAPTGNWQTTASTLCYGYPAGRDFQHVRLWDMPGCGTSEHPSAIYFAEKALHAFDVLIIVAEKELGEYEYTILNTAQKSEIPVVVVITKLEEKVESKIRKRFNTRNPPPDEYGKIVQETTNEARQRVFTCLEKKGLQDIPIFVVSAWTYRDYMKNLEALENTDVQEIISVQEHSEDERFGQEVVDNPEVQLEEYAEINAIQKKLLVCFEVFELLAHIAATAVHRRL